MDSQKSIRVDEVSSTLTYVGDAPIGVSESAAFWRIKRIQTTSTVTKVMWADGNERYDNVWADRASLTYV